MKKYHKNRLCLVFVLFLIISVITSCAPSTRVPITRPAEINLKGFKKIAVGQIKGNIGTSVSDRIETMLFESGYFEVVDRENVDRIMKEHSLNLSGVIDSNTAGEVGKLVGASALIFGRSSMKYDLKRSKSKEYKDKKGKSYRYYHIKGTAKVNTTFKVVDLITGKILAAKSISEEAHGKNREKNQYPEKPDRDAIIEEAVNNTLNAFMRMIAPYEDYVKVKFEKSKLPEGKNGISLAKNGDWESALDQFKLAVKKSPTDHGAWYNLGIGYEYNYIFKEAIEALEKANRIKPSEKYIREIANVKQMKAEREKLDAQGAITF